MLKKQINICVTYSGAFNYFEYVYNTQQKYIFDILDSLNINYDIFANVDSYIEYRLLNSSADSFNEFIKFHTEIECLKKHLPDKIKLHKKNENLICDIDKDYGKKVFNEKFREKLCLFMNYPNIEDPGTCVKQENGYLQDYPHDLRTYTKHCPYLRNEYLCKKVREYEKKKNKKYDLIITLRPDLIITEWQAINLKNIINDVINNNAIYIQYTQYIAIYGPRPDCFWISTKFMSELVTDEFINEKIKNIPRGKAYPHNRISTQKFEHSSHDYTEDFIDIELKPKLLSNMFKFYEYWILCKRFPSKYKLYY